MSCSQTLLSRIIKQFCNLLSY